MTSNQELIDAGFTRDGEFWIPPPHLIPIGLSKMGIERRSAVKMLKKYRHDQVQEAAERGFKAP